MLRLEASSAESQRNCKLVLFNVVHATVLSLFSAFWIHNKILKGKYFMYSEYVILCRNLVTIYIVPDCWEVSRGDGSSADGMSAL